MDDDSRAPGWRALFNSAGTEPVLESALPDWAGLGRVRAPLREVVRTLREGKHEPAAPAAAPEPAVGAGGSFLQGEHAEAAGTRRYRLYLPASLAGKPPRGLLMMLHGCGQTAEDFAVGTAMNRQAEARRLIVVYPEQTRCDNPATCWNWFRPGDQRRDSGEPAILAGLARHLQAEHGVPDGATFVAGLSAGGSMAAVLGATYPDVFAAVGVHSAVPQGRATDAFSAIAAMRGDTLPSAGQAGAAGAGDRLPRRCRQRGASLERRAAGRCRAAGRSAGQDRNGGWPEVPPARRAPDRRRPGTRILGR